MSSHPSTRTPSMRQIQRQPTIDGLYTIDPQEIGGMEAVPPTPYMYKNLRPMTNEGLQAGIPTKHLAGLQISMSDFAPEYVEDKSYGRPEYFERDGFKTWQSPAPKRVFGIRRRIFWLIFAVVLVVLIGISIGIGVGVGVSTAQQNKDRGALTASSSSSDLPTQTPTPTTISSTASSSTTPAPAPIATLTLDYSSTFPWTQTVLTAFEFDGALAVGATPSFTATSVYTAGRVHATDAATPWGIWDCPQNNGSEFVASNNIGFIKHCYTDVLGSTVLHRAGLSNFDDCIDECARWTGGAAEANTLDCTAVTFYLNLTVWDDPLIGANCFLKAGWSGGNPGNWTVASAQMINRGDLGLNSTTGKKR